MDSNDNLEGFANHTYLVSFQCVNLEPYVIEENLRILYSIEWTKFDKRKI